MLNDNKRARMSDQQRDMALDKDDGTGWQKKREVSSGQTDGQAKVQASRQTSQQTEAKQRGERETKRGARRTPESLP